MKVVFFTLDAYDMLTGGHQGEKVGGAQLQQILIGKELSQRGHDVFFIEYDASHKREGIYDGIEVILKPRPTGSELSRAIDVLRGTTKVLRKINPDVCYRRVLDFEILPLALYSSLSNTRFVYGIAHDDELTNEPHMFSDGIKSTRPYIRLNRFALSRADAVIAQNNNQFELAKRSLNTEIHKIPNCYFDEPATPIDWEYDSPVVFWAARFQSWKQPEVVVDLAKHHPDVTFVMAGGAANAELHSEIKEKASSIGNLVLLGHVPYEEIDRFFAAADVFLNTSKAEGFPNTFLQAWAHGTPVVSLGVDPDSILQSEKIGLVADNSIDQLHEHIESINSDTKLCEKLGEKSQEYFRRNHTVDSVATKYENVIFDQTTSNDI